MKNEVTIIINSDDFGISNSVNKAIVHCFEHGLITSTTLMAHMPGFDDAVQHAHTNPALKDGIGLHMNLTEGQPLTDAIKKQPRFCNAAGQLIYDRKKPIFSLAGEEKNAVYTEIKAQIDRLVKHGVIPTHLDAHHHVHTEFGIAQIYLAAAKEYGIRKMRLTKNIGNASFPKRVYKNLFNTYLKSKGVTTTNFFCSADEFNNLLRNNQVQPGTSYEIMVHAMMDNNNVVDIDHKDMAHKMSPIVTAGYRAITYAAL